MKLTRMMMAWALPCLVYAAPPTVSNVQVKQDEQRLVTITYTLSDAPASTPSSSVPSLLVPPLTPYPANS